MNDNDFFRIEEALSIKLPESYKVMITENKLGATRFHEFVFTDPAKIISVNQRLRKKCFRNRQLRTTHFVFGYQADGSEYYFIDTEVENGFVYMFNRTKTRAYSPDDIAYNLYENSLSSFVKVWCWHEKTLARRETTPPVELTEEQKKEKREAFFLELRKKREEQMNK